MGKSEKELLQETVNKARAKLYKIEAKEALEKSKPFVGRFFKYRNSYSCPQKPSDYWWLYFRVESVDSSRFKGTSFEKDSQGQLTVRTDHATYYHMQGYHEITKKEFNAAMKKFVNKSLRVLVKPKAKK